MAENPYAKYRQNGQQQGVIIRDPYRANDEARKNEDQAIQRENAARDAARLDLARDSNSLQAGAQQFQQGDKRFDNLAQQKDRFNALQAVKDYKAVLPLLISGLKTAPNPQGDSALIYAYAKVMDPGSVVRESEGEMASNTAGFWDAKVEQFKKNFGFDDARGLPAGAAEGLRAEMNRKVASLAKAYGIERLNAQEFAKANGLPPEQVVGRPPAEPYTQEYLKLVPGARQDRQDSPVPDFSNAGVNRAPPPPSIDPNAPQSTEEDRRIANIINAARKGGASFDDLSALHQQLGRGPLGDDVRQYMEKGGSQDFPAATSQESGRMQQIVSTAAQNPLGAGTLAYGNAALGGIPGMMAGEGNEALRAESPWSTLVGDVAGGVAGVLGTGAALKGAATAAGAAPRIASLLANPVTADTAYGTIYGGASADDPVTGALAGAMSGLVPGAIANKFATGAARRTAEDEAMALVPSVDQLKTDANALYTAAENSGQFLDPTQTTQLRDDVAALLAKEGVVSPSGKMNEVHANTKQAMNLLDDYAGQNMLPAQMETVRKVAADAAGSADPSQARVGRSTRDIIDALIDPIIPELPQARQTAARYLQGQELEQARELAGATAGKFSGSGFENALRTQYRGLDTGTIKGREYFDPAVVDAIQRVGRGTPASNWARGIGRMAPTGVVSGGFGLGLGGLGMAAGGPAVGIPLALGAMGSGALARRAATNMTDRYAQLAEATARNGGPLSLNVVENDIPAILAGSVGSVVPPWMADFLSEEKK